MTPSIDPAAQLQQTVDTATQNITTAGWFMLAMLAGVGYLMYRAGRK